MRHTGFTLIELLVVVVIMGVLTSIALPQYRRAMDRSRTAEALQVLPALYDAQERWMIENNYHWDGPNIKDANNTTIAKPTANQLDIEIKGVRSANSGGIQTRNFTYTFGGSANLCGLGLNTVFASPSWSDRRDGLNQVTICYDGREVCCRAIAGNRQVCPRLNIGGCHGD